MLFLQEGKAHLTSGGTLVWTEKKALLGKCIVSGSLILVEGIICTPVHGGPGDRVLVTLKI